MSVIDLGNSAARMLESTTLKAAKDAALRRYQDDWLKCQTADQRESLWHQARALEDGILRELRAFRDDGAVAQREAK